MDKLDKAILAQLEKDARQSHASIARAVHASKSVVNYRISRLEKSIISGYTYISNASLLGQYSYGILIKFKDTTYGQERKLIENIRTIAHVRWTAQLTGTWDALVVVMTQDLPEYIAVQQEIVAQCSSHIKELAFYIDFAGCIGSSQSAPIRTVTEYKPGELYSFAKNEREIYEMLKRRPQASLLDIAHSLSLSYDAVKEKYMRLKKSGLLLRCVPQVAVEKLGLQRSLVFMNISPDAGEQIYTYCKQQSHIERYSKCLGQFNLILTMVTSDAQELKKVIGDIKHSFGNIVHTFEIVHIAADE